MNTMTKSVQQALVDKLREAGLKQSFFTKRPGPRKLRAILATTWTRLNGTKMSFTSEEKKQATAIWG